MTMTRVQVRRLVSEAVLPRYQTPDSAGMDLHSVESLTIAPGATAAVSTGLAFEIPRGCEGQVRPRSGIALNHAVTVVNAPGTVDSDFRGIVKVLLINHGREPFVIKSGERIAQLVIAPVIQAELVEVDVLSETERGAGGFGSTGR